MISVHISPQPALDKWQQTLTASEKQLKLALVRALNKTARWMRAQLTRDTAHALKVKVKDINAGLSLLRAKSNQPESGVTLKKSAGVIKASTLGVTSQTSRGVRTGKHFWPHAFIATMPGGHQGVFRRTSKSSLPIREVQLVVTAHMANIMEKLSEGPALRQFEIIFERELRYLMRDK